MIQVAFESCIFAMLHVQGLRWELWDISCWSRMEAECCVQFMLEGWSDTVDAGILPVLSRKLECLFLGFSLQATLCLMSQSHPALRFSCCWSSCWLQGCESCQQGRWLWVMQVCRSQREWVSLTITRLLLQICAVSRTFTPAMFLLSF